jgi:hypothetical protein
MKKYNYFSCHDTVGMFVKNLMRKMVKTVFFSILKASIKPSYGAMVRTVCDYMSEITSVVYAIFRMHFFIIFLFKRMDL